MKMNYIKQINAFYREMEINPLSSAAISLWYSLMHINNRTRWKESFTVSMSVLTLKSGLSNSVLKRAREELKIKGYIRVESQSGNQSAIYKINSLTDYTDCQTEEVTNEVQGVVHNEPEKQAEHKTVHNSDHNMNHKSDHNPKQPNNMSHNVDHKRDHNLAPLIKHKQIHKQNNIQHQKQREIDAFVFYQENIGNLTPYVTNNLTNWVKDLGEALVLEAMKRALDRNKASWGYIRSILQNWIKKGIQTVDEAHAEMEAFLNKSPSQKTSYTHVQSSPQKEVVPDWFIKRKKEQEKRLDSAQTSLTLDKAKEERERAELQKLIDELSNEQQSNVG
ncbi:DnaD domain-containing protein [Oceanobacillus halotolerans]|uniref:DnaD domain-containing protein n=1 Tax=Oceanobacillus halotolerans TaxID=2663380 RepID=UPI0013D6EF0E|nr:DnaD domain protein [Oceanobacillus halotolerans]